MSELETAIAELYRVFAPYRLGPDFTGCDHCVDPRDTERLARAELRDLSVKDLDAYAFSALTTWGEVPHFKHFLPRLLELVAEAGPEFLELEVLLGKLTYGHWEDWPVHEREAVEGFLQAYWRATLRDDASDGDSRWIDTVLCALGRTGEPLDAYLSEWIGMDDEIAVRQLARLLQTNLPDLLDHASLRNSFWDDCPEQADVVKKWILAPRTFEHLYDRQSALDNELMEVIPLWAELLSAH